MKTTRELIQLGLSWSVPSLAWDPGAARGEFTLQLVSTMKALMRPHFSRLTTLLVPVSATMTFKDYLKFPDLEYEDITVKLAHDNAKVYGVAFKPIPPDADALYLIHGGIRGDKQLVIGTDESQDNVVFGCF